MAISEKKYQKLFEEAQVDAIRMRKERDDLAGWLRVIGRLSAEEGTIERCKAAIANHQPPVTDTERMTWLQAECADLEMTCGGVWRVSCVDGDFKGMTPREAIDQAIEAR
jgi:hypothetical protein